MPETDPPETPPECIAPLLRLGLDEQTQIADPNATIWVNSPRTGSSGGGGSRSWQPPSVEELQKLLPQYEISAFIARGGMGAVYKGTQKTLRRAVAIKVLPPDLEDGDKQFAARFKHEAQSMAHLSHPNIVAVFDAGETPAGLLYFVMEYIEGSDVAQLIASEGIVEPLRAIQITTAVCEALAFAHEEGIIHRDIKPSNIMLDKRGRVKVADFGLAKTVNLEHSLLTGSNVAMGTPDFIAPEAMMPGVKLDGRADLYAVGVMLYQMLTGTIPRGRFELPSGVVAKVDKGFDPIVDKAMQTDREKRYSTATEMKTAVEGVTVPKETVVHPATVMPSVPLALAPRGKSKRLIPAVVAAVVLIACAAIFTKNPFGQSPTSSTPVAPAASTASPRAPLALSNGQLKNGTQKLAGVSDASRPWHDAFAEEPLQQVIAKAHHSALGYLMPAGNHWRILPQPLQAAALRVRVVPEAGSLIQLQILLDDGARYYRVAIDREEHRIKIVYSTKESPNDVLATKDGVNISYGQPYEMLLARFGGKLWVMLDGKLMLQVQEPDAAPGQLTVTYFEDAKTRAQKIEYIPLDGLPEVEALKLLGVDETDKPSSAPYPKVDAAGNPVFAPGAWTCMWTAEKEARFGDKKDGTWVLANDTSRGCSVSFTNAGMRARFRNQLVTDRFHPQFNLRAPNLSAMNLHMDPDGTKLQIRDARARGGLSVLAELRLPDPVPAGREYLMEFYAIGQKLIGRVNGQTVTATITGAASPGPLSIYMANADYVRDVEVLNLDGIPEAEALKLVGVDAAKAGEPVAPLPAPASMQNTRINLLPYVDVKRDAVKGTWSVKPDGVWLESTGDFAVLELPYEPPEEYDLEVELTPTAGTHNPNVYLAAAGTSFAWKIDGHGRKMYGFDLLDGKTMPESRTEGVAEAAERLQDGQRHTTTIEVRRGSLRGLLDGQEMVKWSGNFSRLSMESASKLPNPRALGIGSYDRAVIFHKVTVREVSGNGKLTHEIMPASATSIPSTYPQPSKWIDATEAVRTAGLREGRLKVEGDRLVAPAKTGFVLANFRTFSDVAMRVSFSGCVTLKLRKDKLGGYAAHLDSYRAPSASIRLSAEVAGGDKSALLDGGPKRFTVADADDGFHELVLAAKGRQIGMWVDGQQLASATDARFTDGILELVFGAEPNSQPSCVKRIEYGELDSFTATATKDAPFVNSLGMKFVPVPGSSILMCMHETRRKDYAAYAAAVAGVDSAWKAPLDNGKLLAQGDDHPVIYVSWEDAAAFCAWLSKKEGRAYRLPTEHEWNLAVAVGLENSKLVSPEELARKPQSEYPWGTHIADAGKYGNYDGDRDGYGGTAPVMSFLPNHLGIYDLGGNAWEWCDDWINPEHRQRVLRGGGFHNYDTFLRSRIREGAEPSFRTPPDQDQTRRTAGFRAVLVAAP